MSEQREFAPFESRQYDLVLAIRKALRRMFGVSPIRVRIDCDWQSGAMKRKQPFGPSVWLRTGEVMSIKFSAVLVPGANGIERIAEPFMRGDTVSVGLEKWARVNHGKVIDEIRVTRADMSTDLGFSGHVDAEFDIEGFICLAHKQPVAGGVEV